MGVFSGAHKPKPRPRAIIQNQIKTCKESVKKQGTMCAILPIVAVLLPSPACGHHDPSPPSSHQAVSFCIPSRGPPSLS